MADNEQGDNWVLVEESEVKPELPSTEPEATPVEPDTSVEPETPTEPEPTPEPDTPAEPEPTAVPEAEEQPKEENEDKPEESQEETPVEQPAAATPTETTQSEEDKPAEVTGETPVADTTVEVVITISGEEARTEGTASPEPGDDIAFGSYLRLCQMGSDMIKVKKSKGFPRNYRLDSDLLSIVWDSRHKALSRARIAVTSITEVRAGRSTDSFKASKDTRPEDVCFSIIYLSGTILKTLDLAALTVADRTAWLEGLKTLLKQSGSAGDKDNRSRVRDHWLKDLFDKADKDNSGTLDLKEVLRMMHELNVGVSSKVLKKKFKEADKEGATEGAELDGKLNFEEFCSLFKELAARPELTLLFNKYSSKMEWLTVKDLQKFLQIEQGASNPSIEFCTQLVEKYERTDEGKTQGWMSMDGFAQFMLGSENDIINIDRASNVYQDMTHPLSHYYIASSHNTYLLEDQLKGPSSCEAYIRALRKGCRCVELDCWDGPDNEPIIYHGYTFTSKILFKDVIEVIRDHAFAVSSYPVILSIENHCSIPQQHRMAEMMKDILGDMLYDVARDEDRTYLPSPEDLKRKILVKGKKLSTSLEEQDDDDGEVTDEDEAEDIDNAHLKQPAEDKPAEDKPVEETPVVANEEDKPAEDKPAEDKPAEDKPAEDKPAEDKPAEETPVVANGEDKPAEDKPAEDKPAEDKPADEASAAASEDKPAAAAEGDSKPAEAEAQLKPEAPRKQRSVSFRQRQRKVVEAQKPKKKIKLSAKMSKCVNYVQSVHFPGMDGYDGVIENMCKCFHMSSFSENTALRFIKDQPIRFLTYNKIQVSRIYPKGSRVDSSNYDPTPMWNTGCQIVALNYQTPGRAMDLNEGKFRDNGGCGYVLKPSIMRESLSRFNHNQRNASGFGSKVVTIKVISGQQLPKPGDKQGEIIDPYVILQLSGSDLDSQRFKTKTVNDNGFNPSWNETFTMSVRYPELAVLRIKVMDEDWGPNKDDFIGSYSLPLNCLVPGYRHVHLTNGGNKLETGSIFLHVKVQDLVAPNRSLGKTRTGLTLKKAREYPEHHQVGHQGVDVHFRNVPGPLRRAVDLREDYIFSLLYFKDLVGHGSQAGISDCVELLVARATNAGVKFSLEKQGDNEETSVFKVVSVETSTTVPSSLATMFDGFNHINATIQAILIHAPPTANELEVIYKEASGLEKVLRQHITEGPNPPKKPEMVLDQYARTMFSVNSEASQLRRVLEEAIETLRQLSDAGTSAGLEVVTPM